MFFLSDVRENAADAKPAAAMVERNGRAEEAWAGGTTVCGDEFDDVELDVVVENEDRTEELVASTRLVLEDELADARDIADVRDFFMFVEVGTEKELGRRRKENELEDTEDTERENVFRNLQKTDCDDHRNCLD